MTLAQLRADRHVTVSLAAAAIAFATAGVAAYTAANANPTYWAHTAVLTFTGVVWMVAAYRWAQTAWLQADTARIRAERERGA